MRNLCSAIAIFIFFSFLLLPFSALAAPEIHEFLRAGEDLQNVKTVLVMPLKIPVTTSDPDIVAAIKTKWAERIVAKQKTAAYQLITPKQLLQRHSTATGARVNTRADEASLTRQAMTLAPRYADAVLSMNVLKCDYVSVRHLQKFENEIAFEEKYEWEEGKWVIKKEAVEDRQLKPAWTERFTEVELRLELWSAKKGHDVLIYSCSVAETVSETAHGGKLPRLTDLTAQCMETAMQRLSAK